MTQPELRQLASLLSVWEQDFVPSANRDLYRASAAQPMYADIVHIIRLQIEREISK